MTSGAQLPGGKAGGHGVSLLGWYTDSLTDSMNVGDTGASQCVLQDTQPVPFSQTGHFSAVMLTQLLGGWGMDAYL